MTFEGGSAKGAIDEMAVRARYQRVRAVFGLLLAGIGVAGVVLEAPGAVWKIPAGVAILTDAVLRARRQSPLAWSVGVDALVAASVVGFGDDFLPALAAAAAYLAAVIALFVGNTRALALGAVVAGVVAARSGVAWLSPGEVPAPATILVWLETGLYLTALMVTLGSGARLLRKAREAHAAALDSERRASEMKTEFVSMITHELRTPLTNIAGFALTVQDSWETLDPVEVAEFMGIIVGEAEHLSNLVEDVLAIPRLEAGKLLLDVTEFQLQPAAYRIADLIYPAGGEKEASVAVAGNVVVRADPNRVEQILRNILENAHNHGGQNVTIEAERDSDHWVVKITDDGPGIPAEARHRIFEAFEQVREDADDQTGAAGFGLGLAVCRHLVDAMGGTIWYESVFPVGARFCFTLPLAEADTGTQQQPLRRTA
jgi:signal transduction histidine kinase